MALLNEFVDPDEKQRLMELVRRAAVSRDMRRQRCAILKQWYKMGSEEGGRATYNKLHAHLKRVRSFLFAPGTVRFGVYLPPAVRELWLSAASVARDEFRQTWDDANADSTVKLALEWSLVYGCVPMKLQADPHTGFRLGYIQPWDFGVTREDVSDLDEQDVFAHWYTLSVPQVERWVHGEKLEADYLGLVREHANPKRNASTTNRLVVSSVTGTFPSGTVSGGFPSGPNLDEMQDAVVIEPTVDIVDVWERRMFRRKEKGAGVKGEIFEDFLVTTILVDANEPMGQRRNTDLQWTRTGLNTTLPSETPFVMLVPNPDPDYFWGSSELDNLTALQRWLEEQRSSIKSIVERQVEPPTFFSGVTDFEEAGRAMRTTGGSYGTAEPNSKMQDLMPTLAPEILAVFKMTQEMFSDTSNLPSSIAEPGQMSGGVRSAGHFGMAAGIGAGSLREMALTVEQSLSTVATKAFHILQRHSTDAYTRPDGPKFLLSQIPSAIRLLVNSHSSAPIFNEQTQAKAVLLQKAGAIDAEDLVELIDPPNREEYKAKAKKLSQAKAEQTKEAMRIIEEKALKRPVGQSSTK